MFGYFGLEAAFEWQGGEGKIDFHAGCCWFNLQGSGDGKAHGFESEFSPVVGPAFAEITYLAAKLLFRFGDESGDPFFCFGCSQIVRHGNLYRRHDSILYKVECSSKCLYVTMQL